MHYHHDDGHAHVDGDALAGPLSELFAVDVTGAAGNCAGCGLSSTVASMPVYDRAPGVVARCPGCDSVIMRLVRSSDAAWLDLTGTSVLHIPLPAG